MVLITAILINAQQELVTRASPFKLKKTVTNKKISQRQELEIASWDALIPSTETLQRKNTIAANIIELL